ncbi:MAG: reprolysin-like metallopeptidase [Phycisphaerae bacterium]
MRTKRCNTRVVAAAALAAAWSVTAGAQPVDANVPAGGAATAAPTSVKRAFAITTMPARPAVALQPGAVPIAVDVALLSALRADEPVRFALTADRELEGVVQRIERRSATRFSVFGRVADDADGYFILAVEDNVAAGIFESPVHGALHKLVHLGDGVSQIAPIDRRNAPECALPANAGAANRGAVQPAVSGAPSASARASERGGDGDEGGIAGGCPAPPENFDVIIAYTQAAAAEAGGTTAIQAVAQLAVDQANQAYDDSEIDPRMTLLFTKQVPYVESQDIYDDRDALADPTDNQLDALHDDRDEFGADFVCLFVAAVNNSNAAGVAFCTPTGPEEGFCVVLQSQAVSNISFAHEIGHLQGCAHDFGNAGVGCNETCYAYGWRFFGNSGSGWRTVMAYNNNAGDFTRIAKFSNPGVNHDGQPTGNDNNPCIVNENNARLINETALSRESWRSPRFDVWVEQGASAPRAGTHRYPWATVATGAANIYSGTRIPLVQPVLNIKSGSYDETLTISTPMTIRSCGGAATIGR